MIQKCYVSKQYGPLTNLPGFYCAIYIENPSTALVNLRLQSHIWYTPKQPRHSLTP